MFRSVRQYRVVLAALVGVCVVGPAQAEYATNPLPRPHFSIDGDSPTAALPGIGSHDILTVDGQGSPPAVAYSGVGGLGLMDGDDIDALSKNHGALLFRAPVAVLFSVDRDSTGAVKPDPELSGMFPYNVLDQAELQQAAGDEYMGLQTFFLDGGLQLGGFLGNNTLIGNQADVGGCDHNLVPESSPVQPNSAPLDDMNAHYRPDGPNLPVYLSLTADSPSNGGSGGATVFFDRNPQNEAPGNQRVVYAEAHDLGLDPGDDLDALVVSDRDGDLLTFNPATDRLLFSLAPNSPTLAELGASPADVLITGPSLASGFGGLAIVVSHSAIGLREDDNLDALTVEPCVEPSACVHDFAIMKLSACCRDGICVGDMPEEFCLRPDPVCADFNGDCVVGRADLAALLGGWGSCPAPCVPGACNSSCMGDLNHDCLVTPTDLAQFIGGWGGCPANCVPGDQTFCAVDASWFEDESCDLPEATPCPPPPRSCCVAHVYPGCSDPDCRTVVCGLDPFCCSVLWDDICAAEAAALCSACTPG